MNLKFYNFQTSLKNAHDIKISISYNQLPFTLKEIAYKACRRSNSVYILMLIDIQSFEVTVHTTFRMVHFFIPLLGCTAPGFLSTIAIACRVALITILGQNAALTSVN